jgi:hypothetical protein
LTSQPEMGCHSCTAGSMRPRSPSRRTALGRGCRRPRASVSGFVIGSLLTPEPGDCCCGSPARIAPSTPSKAHLDILSRSEFRFGDGFTTRSMESSRNRRNKSFRRDGGTTLARLLPTSVHPEGLVPRRGPATAFLSRNIEGEPGLAPERLAIACAHRPPQVSKTV